MNKNIKKVFKKLDPELQEAVKFLINSLFLILDLTTFCDQSQDVSDLFFNCETVLHQG